MKLSFISMRNGKLNLKSTFFNLLGYVGGAKATHTPLQLEHLRLAMLETLGESGSAAHARVARQLRFADDVQALWYARSELMAALAEQHGEARARQELERLGALFTGLLPAGMTAGATRTGLNGPSMGD